MNSVIVVCLLIAIVGAKVVPPKVSPVMAIDAHGDMVKADKVPDDCDYSCTDQDIPVCANNGQCMQKFSSRCTMAAYNCRHPQKRFDVVENWRCEESWAPMCGIADRKELNL